MTGLTRDEVVAKARQMPLEELIDRYADAVMVVQQHREICQDKDKQIAAGRSMVESQIRENMQLVKKSALLKAGVVEE